MDFIKFVPSDLLILIPALYIVGMFIKSTPKVINWTIPWILLILGICGAALLQRNFSINQIIEGIICAGAAVYANQLIKQTSEGLNSNSEKEGR